MELSKHNIVSRIKDSSDYFVVNLLSGNADLLDNNEAAILTGVNNGEPVNKEVESSLAQNGYLVNSIEEQRLYRNRYYDFIDQRDDEEVQLFFVMNYSCNFGCSYCYQDEYTNPNLCADNSLIDAFFGYLKMNSPIVKSILPFSSGEPLLNSPKQRDLVAYFVEKANEADLDICLVTNGYSLEEYIEILKRGRIREVQVTLDGTSSVHNTRRFLKGGGATFDKIVRGVDACLENQLPVNLRMVIDKSNIGNLPDLATFAIERGWTKSPYFKTQIGRNYELHHCQSTPDKLFTRLSLYESIFELTQKHPHIQEFYKPSYSVAKYLAEKGQLPDLLFDACPACKSEWAFDYTGHIYSCTATVGKEGESLGTFYPVITKNERLISEWESRDVTTIPECKNCSVQLACGGGCGSVAKNNNGSICSPDCRPVKELLEIGLAAYFKE